MPNELAVATRLVNTSEQLGARAKEYKRTLDNHVNYLVEQRALENQSIIDDIFDRHPQYDESDTIAAKRRSDCMRKQMEI